MKRVNLNLELNRLIYSESAKDLGVIRFVLGGAFIVFAGSFMINGVYLVGSIIALIALLIIGHCSELIFFKDEKLFVKKTGIFSLYIITTRRFVENADSIVVIKRTSRQKRVAGQNVKPGTQSFNLYFEFPNNKIYIFSHYGKTEALKMAREISKHLSIGLKDDKECV